MTENLIYVIIKFLNKIYYNENCISYISIFCLKKKNVKSYKFIDRPRNRF